MIGSEFITLEAALFDARSGELRTLYVLHAKPSLLFWATRRYFGPRRVRARAASCMIIERCEALPDESRQILGICTKHEASERPFREL
jgi:hypothetical protein